MSAPFPIKKEIKTTAKKTTVPVSYKAKKISKKDIRQKKPV
jgi:hypothetical protein